MSEKQVRLNQSHSGDHLPALVAIGLMCLDDVTSQRGGSGANAPCNIFDPALDNLA